MTLAKPARVPLLAALVLALSAGAARAQTGATPIDWDDLAKLPRWQPEPMGYAEFYAVDHRAKLPPVGKQAMNDCTSWAFAAAKSFHEATDQGWRPDRPGRIFSPRFIYNQINQGKDAGSSALHALELLRSKGCATTATCPYAPGDFTGKPTPRAFEEGACFKIRDFYTLQDGGAIRTALSQGHVVAIGVKTNPVFNSGKYEVYTPALHADGQKKRTPGQKHGFHALLVVGFDDTRSAFLIRNSWGSEWGQAGHCWVHYDVAATFNSKTDEDAHLIDYALVMIDERAKVAVGADGIACGLEPPTKETLRAAGQGEYRGYDAALARHRYAFSVELNGQAAALDLVEDVTWTYEAAEKPIALRSASRGQYFRATGAQFRNEFEVKGRVLFRDKTTREVAVRYRLETPNADQRRIAIAFADRYYGQWKVDGVDKPVWSWSAGLQGESQDLGDVARVVWSVGKLVPSEPVIDATREHCKGASPGRYRPGGLALRPNRVAAKVFFADGSSKELAIDPVFASPVDEEIALESDYTEEEGPGGATSYNFTAWLKLPGRYELLGIDHVTYDYGPTFGGATQLATWSQTRFLVHGATRKEFRLRASVRFSDGRTLALSKWIELGKEAKYADPRRIEIGVKDTYMGVEKGKPTWWATLAPTGDAETIAEIAKVQYRLPGTYGGGRDVVTESSEKGFRMVVSIDEPIEVVATVTYRDGNFTRFKVSVRPIAPRDDRLALGITTWQRDHIASRRLWYYDAEVTGPELELRRIARIDLFPVIEKGLRQRVVVDPGYHAWPGLTALHGVANEPFALEAVVSFTDGSRQRFVSPVKQAPQKKESAPAAPLALELRERFLGIEKGRPVWRLALWLSGDEAALAAVAKASHAFLSEGLFASAEKAPFAAELRVERPGTVLATLTLKDGTTQVLAARTTGLGGRTSEPLLLRQARSGAAKTAAGRTTQELVVYVDGWESELSRVKAVEYALPPEVGGGKRVVAERRDEAHAGFATTLTLSAPCTIDAVATFADGSKRELSVQTGLPREPVGWDLSDAYFGQDEKGAPSWLVSFRLTGDVLERFRYNDVDYFHHGALRFLGPVDDRRVYAKPLFQHYALSTEPFAIEEVLAAFNAAEWTKLRGARWKPRAPRVDALGIEQSRGLAWPGQAPEEAEWVSALVGPERDLARIASVRWTFAGGSAVTVGDRFGERTGGFEARAYGKAPPAARATVKLLDGAEVEIPR